eukprot:CAMPEP_0174275666 /NCGR_PEP_ID=MMETSP0439-20130205/59949_1 /TAXON_ID=0 /ORGANISM="Stereomyxa ramosa, Strain Chinc5" /LENGTH=590 /DNA_ID=CAMNT_0015367799 /DNA_START=2150 /DNA_END=3919 /DNA_ORIENTATION=+
MIEDENGGDEGPLGKGFCCGKCGNKDLDKFSKEKDILDVWFDSGVSHYVVLPQALAQNQNSPNTKQKGKEKEQEKQSLLHTSLVRSEVEGGSTQGVIADLYLEGSDQHRGWFQSSMFCSLVLSNHSCTKAFLTHGFVVDSNGVKMSKSAGNVISPMEVIKQYNADVLRLWICSVNYSDDASLSHLALAGISQDYRKIRGTCRFLLQNTADFNPTQQTVQLSEMYGMDQYALATLRNLYMKTMKGYASYNFASVTNAIVQYCRQTLSGLYFEIVKNRLYFPHPDSKKRRSVQTVFNKMLEVITRLIAPILSFLAEEVSDFHQRSFKPCSIHLQDFVEPVDVWSKLRKLNKNKTNHCKEKDNGEDHNYNYIHNKLQTIINNNNNTYNDSPSNNNKHNTACLEHETNNNPEYVWEVLVSIRNLVLKELEKERKKGVIKSSKDAKVIIRIDTRYLQSSNHPLHLSQFLALNSLIETEQSRINSNQGDYYNYAAHYNLLSEFFVVSQCSLIFSSTTSNDNNNNNDNIPDGVDINYNPNMDDTTINNNNENTDSSTNIPDDDKHNKIENTNENNENDNSTINTKNQKEKEKSIFPW